MLQWEESSVISHIHFQSDPNATPEFVFSKDELTKH